MHTQPERTESFLLLPKMAIIVLLLTIYTVQLHPQNAFAVESTMVVELEKRIHTNIADIQNAKESLADTNTTLEQNSLEINEEFKSTTQRDDQRFLMKKMFGVHAAALNKSKTDTIKVMHAVEDLTGNLEALNDSIKTSAENGVDIKSEAHRTMTKQLLIGMGGMFKAVQSANPQNESLTKIADQLAYNDAAFRRAFATDKNISIEKQIEYMEDQHGVLVAGLKLIESEKFNLRHAFNLIMREEISDAIYNIDTNIGPIYQSILTGKNMIFSMIDQYKKGPGAPRRYQPVRDINHIGQW